MYLDTIRERLRCHEVEGGEGGGGTKFEKWVDNQYWGRGVVNKWGD